MTFDEVKLAFSIIAILSLPAAIMLYAAHLLIDRWAERLVASGHYGRAPRKPAHWGGPNRQQGGMDGS